MGFLIHLMEVKRRDLHLERAYSGLYTYLVKLGFSEWESRARSIAVTAAEKYRSILGLLQAGRLTLTTLALIGPHLNADNYRSLLRKSCRRSKREVEALIAGLDRAAQASHPLAMAVRRLGFSFDGAVELDALIRRARDLLFHKYPGGGMEFILLDAVSALLDRIDPERRWERRLKRQRARRAHPRGRGRRAAAIGNAPQGQPRIAATGRRPLFD